MQTALFHFTLYKKHWNSPLALKSLPISIFDNILIKNVGGKRSLDRFDARLFRTTRSCNPQEFSSDDNFGHCHIVYPRYNHI